MKQPPIDLIYTWHCEECDTYGQCTVEQMQEIGTPVCGDCGEDMTLLPEGAEISGPGQQDDVSEWAQQLRELESRHGLIMLVFAPGDFADVTVAVGESEDGELMQIAGRDVAPSEWSEVRRDFAKSQDSLAQLMHDAIMDCIADVVGQRTTNAGGKEQADHAE